MLRSGIIPVRIILNYTIPQIWEILKGDIKYIDIVYEDNVTVKTHYKQVIFNRYFWAIFEHYQQCPISSKLSLQNVLDGGYYTTDTHNRLFELIVKDVCLYYQFKTYEAKAPLMKLVYKVFNNIYNDLVMRIGEYISTIDILDLIQVVDDPKIVDIHANLKDNPISIEGAYKQIGDILRLSPNKDNMFIHAYNCGSINTNQANQCIGPRGLVTDIERTVYKLPILSGFIRGLNTIYELSAESRSAAKALNAADNHIKMSEYGSRRLQLLAMSVERVVHTDCGSQDYLDFLVKPGDLKLLRGKWYLTENGTLADITGNETHLENTVIKLRHVLGCTLHNPHEICSTCFGRMAENIPPNSNVGHMLTAFLMSITTQALLSTKHLLSSVKDSILQLFSPTTDYFYVKNSDKMYIRRELKLENLSIVLSPSDVPKLMDVISLTHTNISTSKIGEISDAGILYNDPKVKITTPRIISVSISSKDRPAILTSEFFCYMKQNKIIIDVKGNYVINMAKWKKDQPVFVVPLKEDSLIKFVNKLTSIIETDYDKITNPNAKLELLYNHVNSKLKINLVILEVLIYASTVYDRANKDYSLGRNSPNPKTGKQTQVFSGRSLGQLYVFQDQFKEMFDSNAHPFKIDGRIDHPMDIFFSPREITTLSHEESI